MSVFEEMFNQVAKCNEIDKMNKTINESLTVELEIYKEQIKILEDRQNIALNDKEKYIDSQLREVIVYRNAKVVEFQNQIHYLKLQLSATVEKLSMEQAFWLPISKPDSETPPVQSEPVLKEIPLELPTISLVKDRFNKMRSHVNDCENVVTVHTMVTGFLKEITDMKEVFTQMKTKVAKCFVERKTFEIKEKELLLENDRLLELIISQDLVHTVVNTLAIIADNQKMEKIEQAKESSTLDSDLDYALISSTSTSRSKPPCNTKKNKISRPTSSNKKNKVEDQLRSVKSSLNKKNHVFEPVYNANVKHSVLNANSELICATCNECMFDAIHDFCVLAYLNDVNVRDKSKSAKSKKKKVWKPTGKIFTHVGYWKPTCRTFIKDGNMCPLTRIRSTTVVLPKKPISTTAVKKIPPSNNNSGKLKDITNIVSSTVRFGNDHVAAIRGYGDYQIGNVTISQKIQVRLNATVCNIQTDNGTEFVNQTLQAYYDDVRISHQTSVARTPQQNGVVERRNHTLVEVARKMLIFSKAPLFLWVEAIATACYTQNRSLIRRRHKKPPYELIHDKKPNLTYFHFFGALCYPTNDGEDPGKLKPKANFGIFVGYAPAKKAYRIYNGWTHLIMFKISMMGKMSFFLGLRISQSPRGIFINETRYALEILKKYGMDSSNLVDTPMHLRPKHIDVRYYFIEEQVENCVVELYFIRTEYQPRALPKERFEFLINKLGIKSMSRETLKSLAEENEE
ncbi:retrovirus-related pol polyprotein from transposon TNT 1-94 [Tanacetum coccineum]